MTELNEPDVDPTYVPVVTDDRRNPLVKRMRGTAIHGNMDFDVPFISEISPGFYQGGCEPGLILPNFIEHVVSLYKWGQYVRHDNVKTFREVTMYDSLDGPDRENVLELATLVNECREQGPTLVHCQAGLNRSGLIAATALMLNGMSAQRAIAHLRNSRSNAVLCNPVFEEWLLALDLNA